jgi:hydrogenase/urease accessory protein HupE
MTDAPSSSHKKPKQVAHGILPWLARACVMVLCCLGCCRPLSAHTFTAIVADLLQDNSDLSMTLRLNVLDVIAIINNSPTNFGNTLNHSQLISGTSIVQAYLEKHVRISVDGKLLTGKCLGYVPDLIDPPQPGKPVAEFLPDRLPFLLVWTLPAGAKRCSVTFDLLIDVVGTGVVHANLHRGDAVESKYTGLGTTVEFELTTVSPDAVPAVDNPAVMVGNQATTTPLPMLPPQTTTTAATSSMSAWQLLSMGFRHIVPEGLDHILFVVCLFLLSPKLKPLLIQVTAFTVAHSVTLALAMTGIVLLPSRFVETIIALSIVVMAVENLYSREVKPWRWILVFMFGLIHGLGFAGSFSQLQMSDGDAIRSLLLLNIGIELGQLTVVGVCAGITFWMWRYAWYTRFVIMPISGGIAGLACWWTIERAMGW